MTLGNKVPRKHGVDLTEFKHTGCPDPKRCACDCSVCKLAWVHAGRPARLPAPSVHIPLEASP